MKAAAEATPASDYAYKVVSLASVTPYERNPRTHSAEQIEQLRASIREFGFTNPLLIDENDRLIAGHGRMVAAQAEGRTELPAIVIAGLTDTQRKALLIADNQLAANAGWDYEILKAELESIREDGYELGIIGFTDAQLAGILLPSTTGLTDPDDAPELPSEPVARPGDIWVMGRHRLICGDATSAIDVARVLGPVKPNLMVTDPPYGVEYDAKWRLRAGINRPTGAYGKVSNDDRSDWSPAWALFPGEVAYVWHGALHSSIVQASLEATGFHIRAQVIWAKNTLVIGRGHYHWQHEPCWYAVKKSATGHWHGDRKQTTLWEIPKPQKSETGHSTQKPVECMKRPIENNSSPGQAIYEPFSGSGTTIIACEMTGRTCFALELNPGYVDVAVLRWQAFTGQTATREALPKAKPARGRAKRARGNGRKR